MTAIRAKEGRRPLILDSTVCIGYSLPVSTIVDLGLVAVVGQEDANREPITKYRVISNAEKLQTRHEIARLPGRKAFPVPAEIIGSTFATGLVVDCLNGQTYFSHLPQHALVEIKRKNWGRQVNEHLNDLFRSMQIQNLDPYGHYDYP
ncbi:hypothetical protein O181_035538 [Austropuccinia psidii MF-1]|uniref:Uncharacterized protein n=1 Tax=Austropuccinia psidii MF-1 TaxID=1389203 RepID=A0A9Q3D7N8_9BASI|nr:hypothetical protein [Austropuccinia psidii MF-1]